MKRLFLLALICSMSLSMVGCSGGDEVYDEEDVYDEEYEDTEDSDDEYAQYEEDVNTAIELLKGYSAEALYLPVAASEYSLIADDDYLDLEGTPVVSISAHADLGDGRSQGMGTFYVDVENEVVYRFDVESGTSVEVEK